MRQGTSYKTEMTQKVLSSSVSMEVDGTLQSSESSSCHHSDSWCSASTITDRKDLSLYEKKPKV